MAWTPDQVAALLSNRYDDSNERVSKLHEVLAGIRNDGEETLAAVVEKLADGARDAHWRLPLGDSGLLQHVLASVPAKELGHALNKQALRLVGNACADCDDNRAKVVGSGKLREFIMGVLTDPEQDALLPFAIAAALNVCVDYKPAQEHASEAGLSKVLVSLVSGDRLSSCQSSLSHIMTILELLSNQDAEPRNAKPNTPALLLELATSERYDADLDSFMEICTPALAYLTFQDLQAAFLENDGTEVLQLAFHQLYTRFDSSDADADTTIQLKQVGDAFLTVFADISSLPSFPVACPLDSKPVQTLIDWLASPTLPNLQTAACLSLGNLSRSDESSAALLERVQDPLINILARAIPPAVPKPEVSAPPLQLTHAALSFLKNLAIPQANKPPLGSALLDPARPLLPRLWTSTRTQPQLQFAAVSLTRLLLANCPPNIRHICAPLSDSDPNVKSPSNLALLTATAASADEDPIKVEAARAVSLVCRALHTFPLTELLDSSWTWPCLPDSTHSSAHKEPTTTTTPTPQNGEREEETQQPLTSFYTAHNTAITTSLRTLLTHPRFPSLRSEAIFALALMSRSSSSGGGDGGDGDDGGAQLALRVLQSPTNTTNRSDNNSGATWQALAKAITGSESAELAGVFTARQGGKAEEVDAEREQDENKAEGTEDVTVDKLSLEPQQVDPQGPKAPPAKVAQMDRENAMVLVAELLRRFPEELSSLRRQLEDILNKGGKLVVQDRSGTE